MNEDTRPNNTDNVFAYIRVSTKEQNINRQLKSILSKVPNIRKSHVFIEKKSGASTKGRSELNKLMEQLRPGDIIYVHSIDRLGRNLYDILKLVKEIENKKAMLVAIKQGINSSDKMGKIFIYLCGMMAEIELNLIHERTREGIDIAKAHKKMGRPTRKLSEAELLILKDYYEHTKSASECIKLLNMSRSGFYWLLQRYKDQLAIKGENESPSSVKESIDDDMIIEL